MKKKIVAVLLASVALFHTLAQADTVTVTQYFDLRNADTFASNYLSLNSNEFSSVKLKAGDTVQLNYRFFGDQHLQIKSTGGSQGFNFGMWGVAGDPANNFGISNVSFNLIQPFGSGYPSPFNGDDQASGDSAIGASFYDNFLANGASVNFTGFQTNFHIDTMDQIAGFYNAAYFNVSADSLAVVPEPAGYALLGLGLGLMAFLSRRRSAK